MNSIQNINDPESTFNSSWLLVLGVVCIAAANMSYGIDLIGWIANLPLLLYLTRTKGWKSRAFFVLSLITAWSFVVFKIVTPPIPYAMIFLFSVPISLFHLPAYLIWDRFKTNKFAVILFPAIFTIMEWIQYTFTPFASWGVAAYTQTNSPAIMQIVSFFGMAGLSFLIYWTNSSIAKVIEQGKPSFLSFYLPFTILVLVFVIGSLRLQVNHSNALETIKVAAVGSDSEVAGLPLPDAISNEKVVETLFERTRTAANAGAKIVVWNEASFYSMPQDEPELSEKIKSLAKESKISIVASYVVPVSINPLKYENKYQFISPHGEVIYTYLKHEPVPGEPAIQGRETLEVFTIQGSRIGGAICYDYDFPYLAHRYGKLNADIVCLPSSDWRGIDPLHTKMAAFRAVEQGHSIVRSTRFGLSAAITPLGEIKTQMSSFDKNDKIMIADLPTHGIKTVYSIIGDSFVYLCVAFVCCFFLAFLLTSKKVELG